eukprot:TRINITY_DN50032_c0_g1_i1.p1 TRINITY_DN50032_c0_g1~~TRINITY_DN50032_c0_g1_i1.p1  ORF type:complete len:638 (-),score=78.77 TRINITY_DN50032_c0_g1_i1:176-2089(-)
MAERIEESFGAISQVSDTAHLDSDFNVPRVGSAVYRPSAKQFESVYRTDLVRPEGVVNKEVIMNASFDAIDANKDGVISRQEFSALAALEKAGAEMTSVAPTVVYSAPGAVYQQVPVQYQVVQQTPTPAPVQPPTTVPTPVQPPPIVYAAPPVTVPQVSSATYGSTTAEEVHHLREEVAELKQLLLQQTSQTNAAISALRAKESEPLNLTLLQPTRRENSILGTIGASSGARIPTTGGSEGRTLGYIGGESSLNAGQTISSGLIGVGERVVPGSGIMTVDRLNSGRRYPEYSAPSSGILGRSGVLSRDRIISAGSANGNARYAAGYAPAIAYGAPPTAYGPASVYAPPRMLSSPSEVAYSSREIPVSAAPEKSMSFDDSSVPRSVRSLGYSEVTRPDPFLPERGSFSGSSRFPDPSHTSESNALPVERMPPENEMQSLDWYPQANRNSVAQSSPNHQDNFWDAAPAFGGDEDVSLGESRSVRPSIQRQSTLPPGSVRSMPPSNPQQSIDWLPAQIKERPSSYSYLDSKPAVFTPGGGNTAEDNGLLPIPGKNPAQHSHPSQPNPNPSGSVAWIKGDWTLEEDGMPAMVDGHSQNSFGMGSMRSQPPASQSSFTTAGRPIPQLPTATEDTRGGNCSIM